MDELHPVRNGVVHGQCSIGSDRVDKDDSTLLEPVVVEVVAQVASALLKFPGGRRNGSIGVLTCVNNFVVHQEPPSGTKLDVEVRQVKRLDSFLIVEGTVFDQGKVLAEGQLQLCLFDP